jgi:PRTRC genetic system protein E
MTLFTKFAPLVKAGVVVHLTLRAVGKDMQLEILPVCDSGKTGITVPPRAFLGTPEELDEKIPGMLDTYVSAATDLNDQIAVTTAVMEKAQESAREVTKKAAEVKPAASARTSSTAVAGAKPAKARNTNAGFLDEEEAGGPDGDGGDPDGTDLTGTASGGGSQESARASVVDNLF